MPLTYMTRNGWNLERSGSSEIYLHQLDPVEGVKFVARFKYARPGANCTAFAKFLTEHFTPREFFDLRKLGLAPAQVLEKRGYVSPNVLAARAAQANA